jgi:ketosteroid isomerase-like protein
VGCGSQSASPWRKNSRILRNKKLVKTFFQHFSTGELDQAFALVSDYVSCWVPGDLPLSGTKTKAQYMQVVGRIQQGFRDGMAEKDPSTERVRIENSVRPINLHQPELLDVVVRRCVDDETRHAFH